MIVTRSVDTALRVLVHLARQPESGGYLKARQIERQLKVPPFALRKILWSLTRGGLVVSLPGRDGGFRLGRRPAAISLAEVLRSVEGRVAAYPCRGVDERCELSGRCGVAPVYQDLERALERVLGGYSIEDCLARQPLLQATRGGG